MNWHNALFAVWWFGGPVVAVAADMLYRFGLAPRWTLLLALYPLVTLLGFAVWNRVFDSHKVRT